MAKKKKRQDKKAREPARRKETETNAGRGVLPESAAASRRSYLTCAILLPFVVLAYYPSYQAFYNDFDIWFHLVYGQHYVQNLTWHIDHSVYSWTPAIAKTPYITWIGSSVLYLVHKAFGVTGLFALQYAVLAAAGAIAFRFAKAAGIKPGIPLLAGILLTALTMGPAANYIKPEMFSILFTLLTATLYLRFRMKPSPWVIAGFPLIFLIWVNTHGLWQFGLIFLGIVFAVDVAVFTARRDQAMEGRALAYLAIAGILTFAALCINPFGAAYPIGFVKSRLSDAIDIFLSLNAAGNVLTASAFNVFGSLFPVSLVQDAFSGLLSASSGGPSVVAGGNGGSVGSEVLDHFRGVRAYLNMWEHLFYGQRQPFLTVAAMGMTVMTFLFLFFWAVSWKRSGKTDLPVAASVIAFFFMAMFMGRLALVFSLIWLPSMMFMAWRAGPKPILNRSSASLALTAFIGLTAFVAAAAIYIYEDRSWFGIGHKAYIPDREVQYIMDNDLPGPLFNDYLSGSYLIWTMYPDYKVSIDARHFPYRGRVFNDWSGIGTTYPLNPQGLRAFTNKYPARIALIHHNYQNIITWFNRSPDWVLAYFDEAAVVMVHRDVIPELPQSAIGAIHNPSRFENVANPIILGYAFDVYQKFFGARDAAQIRDYYEQNVSNRYWNKQSTLTNMDRFLLRMKQQGR